MGRVPPLGESGEPGSAKRGYHDLAAATARIGAAAAERHPRVTLAGTFALSGPDAGDMFNPQASVINAGPTISLSVFEGGVYDMDPARDSIDLHEIWTRLNANCDLSPEQRYRKIIAAFESYRARDDGSSRVAA